MASLLIAVFGVVWSEAFRNMVNGATSGSVDAIYHGFILAICVFLIDSLTQFSSSVMGTRLDNLTTNRLQKKAFSNLLNANIVDILDRDSNYYISVIDQFIPVMQQTANKKIRDLLGMILTLIVTSIYLFHIDCWLTIGVLLISLFIPLISNVLSNRLSKRHEVLKNIALKRDSFFQDITQAPLEIRQFKLTDYFLKKLRKYNDDVFENGHRIFCLESAIGKINSFANYLCIIFTLAYGGYRVYLGYIELGDIVAFLYSSVRIFNPLPTIVTMWASIQSTLVKAQDVFKILQLSPERKKQDIRIAFCDIHFNNLEFSYGEKKVIKNVSFDVMNGKITALVGPNGSGKSTLVKLLLGLYSPEYGNITINDYPVEQLNIRSMVNYVPQQLKVFSASIRDNIVLGDDTITDNSLNKAIEESALGDFLKEHEGGIDYILNENGSNVSGGELQRICIARALVRDKPILVLDEHTASVDGITEKLIQTSLRKISNKKTVLLIAHKLETIKAADNIVFLNDGRIEEVGTFDDLIKMNGEFFKFIKNNLEYME